jgi:hypothetical protein
MLKHFRTALVWLMMLAIPTQGFAAATMLHCGPGHQHMLTGPEAAMPAGHTDAVALQHATPHAQSAHSDHEHDHAASVAQHEESADATDQASTADVSDQSLNAKCSVCALCCNAAAIVSTPLVVPLQGVSSAPNLLVSESPVTFFTDGPKRPPRSFLA